MAALSYNILITSKATNAGDITDFILNNRVEMYDETGAFAGYGFFIDKCQYCMNPRGELLRIDLSNPEDNWCQIMPPAAKSGEYRQYSFNKKATVLAHRLTCMLYQRDEFEFARRHSPNGEVHINHMVNIPKEVRRIEAKCNNSHYPCEIHPDYVEVVTRKLNIEAGVFCKRYDLYYTRFSAYDMKELETFLIPVEYIDGESDYGEYNRSAVESYYRSEKGFTGAIRINPNK